MRDMIGGPWREVVQDLLLAYGVVIGLVVLTNALTGEPLVSPTFLLALPLTFVLLVGLIALLRRRYASPARH